MIFTQQPARTLTSMNSRKPLGIFGIFGSSDVGNTIDKAKDVGLLKKGSGVFKRSGDVGGKDLDFFKFKLDTTTTFNARLENKERKNDQDPISLSIINANGITINGMDGIALSKNNILAGKTDILSSSLPTGTYYIRLESAKGSGQNYKLRLSTTTSSTAS
jgi:hypothetical protein